MKRGYVCLVFQPLSVVMHDSNQLNKFWMSCSSINQKRLQEYKTILEWHSFIWSAKNLLKTWNVFFLHPCLLHFFPNLWNVILLLKKIIWLSLISLPFLWKKYKILTSIPQNLVIYQIENLCHHIEHVLFYMWLKYGAIWTNIVIPIDYLLIKLHSETQFLNHLSKHLKTCFNHPNQST